ncbi:MauE/DoxX family redox-associated membrane protein [Streptomyces sp. NRRL S-455]|uniref:MauE/DoxX family redox-associated membrane protein n=1 Tax=Streptomyces sp. NRRL S-455 TaxID=1463908 RepID=UPI002D219B78|nr:MauE/DoxX family redox-associated membrane protein [Streptomyces sp. NRRL S-455]
MTGMHALVGMVFLTSALSKVLGKGAFGAFTASLGEMRLLPPALTRPAALCVLIAETAVCGLLAVPSALATRIGFTVAALLLTAFTVGVSLVVRRGVGASCRCFGTSATPLGARHVVRNVLLTAVAATGAATGTTAAAAHPGGTAVAVAGGLLLGGLVAVLDDLFALFTSVDKGPGNRPGPPASKEETHHGLPDRSRRARGNALHPGSGPHPGGDQATA